MSCLVIAVIIISIIYLVIKNSSPDESNNRLSNDKNSGEAKSTTNSNYKINTKNDNHESKMKKEFNELVSLAESGNAYAQLKLGDMYNQDDFEGHDVTKAIYWYKKSAEQGFAEAQHNLGVAYSNGEGVEQDLKKSLELLTKAAEQGFDKSQLYLYIIYREGIGVDKNQDKSIFWLTKAAENGMAIAQRRLGTYYQSVKNDQRIKEEYKKQIQNGHDFPYKTFKAFFWLVDEGVKKDRMKALEWYEKAAKQGDVESQFLAGALLLGNSQYDDNPETLARAKYWLEMAARNGDDGAKDLLKTL